MDGGAPRGARADLSPRDRTVTTLYVLGSVTLSLLATAGGFMVGERLG